MERAGYEAAELLAKLMAGEKSAACTILVHPTHVVTRQSTDILAIEDREVAEAVRFIRRHSRQSIQVSDVVQEVPLSRRVLEQRFRKVLGRSILDEIKRVRIEQICRLLVETNMSVSNIASALGYSGVDHIARYFREEMKMSPLAYRKQFGQK
jgi:LacI family transcriptional regulator